MNAYRRLYWWLINARKAKGFSAHPFKEKVVAMTLCYGVHSRMIGKKRNTVKLLRHQLYSKEARPDCFPDAYRPRLVYPPNQSTLRILEYVADGI